MRVCLSQCFDLFGVFSCVFFFGARHVRRYIATRDNSVTLFVLKLKAAAAAPRNAISTVQVFKRNCVDDNNVVFLIIFQLA